MKGKDQIEQLFSDKLGNFEAKVDPSLWSSVSSQIGAQSGAAATGMSILTKAIIGVSAASVIAVGAILITSDGDNQPTENRTVAEQINTIDTVPENKEKSVSIIPDQENILKEDNSIETEVISIEETPVLPLNLSDDDLIAEGPADFTLFEEVFEEEESEKEEELLEPELVIEERTAEVEVEAEEIELYTIENLPNVFTPNGDGNNDVFRINSKGLSDFNITILNKQNQVVYQSNDLNFEWRGMDFSQNNCVEGNYVYYLTARDSAGNAVNKYSQLLLRR